MHTVWIGEVPWTDRPVMKLEVLKQFWKYAVPSSPIGGQTRIGGISFEFPEIEIEKYDVGIVTFMRRKERDPQTLWSTFIAEGKSIPLSGYEIHALLMEDDGKAVKLIE